MLQMRQLLSLCQAARLSPRRYIQTRNLSEIGSVKNNSQERLKIHLKCKARAHYGCHHDFS